MREAATVGGNLFAPSPYGDFAAALLALDATVTLAGGFGQRELPLDEFLGRRDRGAVARFRASRSSGRPADAFRFVKVTRVHPKGISVLSIAAQLPLASGRVSGARIAYGAMGPAPVRAKAAERALEGRTLDAAGIAPALAVAPTARRRPTTPSPAPGGGAKSFPSICAGCCSARATHEVADENADSISSQRRGGRRFRRKRRQPSRHAARIRRRPVGEGRLLAGHLRHLHGADRRRRRASPA